MGNQRKRKALALLLRKILVCAFLSIGIEEANGQIAIIVNNNNPVDELSIDELKSIFLGNDMYFENDVPIAVCEFEPDKNGFCLKTYNVSAKWMSRHWFRRIFSGSVTTPPKNFKSKETLMDFISQNERAIGYISFSEIKPDDNIKVLKINGVLPKGKDYLLANMSTTGGDVHFYYH